MGVELCTGDGVIMSDGLMDCSTEKFQFLGN